MEDLKDKRIRELEEELEFYKSSPTAEWYRALTEGLKHISGQIATKELDLSSDAFADSILKIAQQSDKIFIALEKGASLFKQDNPDKDKKGKLDKAGSGVAI